MDQGMTNFDRGILSFPDAPFVHGDSVIYKSHRSKLVQVISTTLQDLAPVFCQATLDALLEHGLFQVDIFCRSFLPF